MSRVSQVPHQAAVPDAEKPSAWPRMSEVGGGAAGAGRELVVLDAGRAEVGRYLDGGAEVPAPRTEFGP